MVKDATKSLAIGALSRATGCGIETIRYYERIRLLPQPPRNAGGRRVYDSEDVRRLAFVRRARDLGFSLPEVKTLLALADGGGSCGDVRSLTLGHLARVRAKIADLERLAVALQRSAARCRGGRAPACPIIETLTLGPTGLQRSSPAARTAAS